MSVFENGPSDTQSDPTIIAKSPSTEPKSPTDTRTDPKVTPKWPQKTVRAAYLEPALTPPRLP